MVVDNHPERGQSRRISPEQVLSPKTPGQTVDTIQQLIRGEVDTDFKAVHEVITQEADTFRKRMDAEIAGRNPEQWKREEDGFDAWTKSAEGMKALQGIVADCVDLIDDDSYNGPPAHDKSHYLKDLYAGLVAAFEDERRPYVRAGGIIGSLMHDFGKTLEVPLTGKHTTGVIATDHAKIGYFLVDRLIKARGNMPKGMADQILYAVVTHQEGKSQEEMSQLVQRADREQLVGAEGVRRMFIADAGLEHRTIKTAVNPQRKTELPLPAKPEDTDLMHHIEFYMRNLFPQIGSHGEERARSLKAESGIFLWLVSDEKVRGQIFAPELERDAKAKKGEQYTQGENKFKKVLPVDVWQGIVEGPTGEDRISMQAYQGAPLEKLLYEFIARKNTNLTWQVEEGKPKESVLDNLRGQLKGLSEDERKRLHEGLSFALVRVAKHEGEMVRMSTNIALDGNLGAIEHKIANLILARYK